MPVRITFVITDLDRGGSPLWLAALAPGLQRRGFEVDVVSLAGDGEIAGVLRQRGIWVTSLHAADATDLTVMPRLVRHLKRFRPQIVFSVLIHANMATVLARPLTEIRALWVQSIHTLQEKPRWHWVVQGVLGAFADAFVAPSHAVIRRLERYGPVPAPMVIANGIDEAQFRAAHAIEPNRRPWPADARVVGYVGRFDPVKRLPLLIRGVAQLVGRGPEFARLHLALVGYGREEAALRGLATDLGIADRVHFPGASREPERWYKTFDAFCSPSAAEGFGLTLLEARAAGLPVIACRTAAIEETLGEAIWLPAECGEADIASAIYSVLKDLQRANTIGAGRVNPSQGEMVEAYARWLNHLARGFSV